MTAHAGPIADRARRRDASGGLPRRYDVNGLAGPLVESGRRGARG